MRLTPLRSPTRPASDTIRRFRPPRKEKRRARAKAKAAFRVDAGWTNPLPHFGPRDLIHAWRGSTASTTVDTYPPSPGNRRRRGGVGRHDRWRHGWRHRAPKGEGAFACEALLRKRPNAQPPAAGPVWGFTACPANPRRPAQHAETQSRFGFGPWLWLWPLRVQGEALQRKRPPFGGLTSLYFSLISRRRSSRKPWAVIGSGYRLGFSGVMHEGSTSIRKSGFGCRKNGTE